MAPALRCAVCRHAPLEPLAACVEKLLPIIEAHMNGIYPDREGHAPGQADGQALVRNDLRKAREQIANNVRACGAQHEGPEHGRGALVAQ